MNLKNRLKNLEKQIEKGKLSKKQTKEELKAEWEKLLAQVDYDIEFCNKMIEEERRFYRSDPEEIKDWLKFCQETKNKICEELKNF